MGIRRICEVKDIFNMAVKDYRNNRIYNIDSPEAIQGRGTFTYSFINDSTIAKSNAEPHICTNLDL